METLINSLEFEYSLKPSLSQVFSHYLFEFEGKVTHWDDEVGDYVVLGEILGSHLDLAAARTSGVDMNDFLDSVSAEISEFKQIVCPDQPCHLPANRSMHLKEVDCDSLIYINKIMVDPAHRGKHIGTHLMQRLSEVIDMRNGLVGLKAFPVSENLETRYTRHELRMVEHFYERLGFQHTADHFMKKDARTCVGMLRKLQVHQPASAA